MEGIHFIVVADIPGVTDEQFAELAEEARALCSISKILTVPHHLGRHAHHRANGVSATRCPISSGVEGGTGSRPSTPEPPPTRQLLRKTVIAMQHNTFGRRTGLRVSELALGTSNFGTGWATGADHATSSAIFTAFADAGGTFIDTADTYQHGESETYLADFLAADRDHFTVASKYGFGSGTHTGVTATGNSRKALRRSLEATLTRLGTDYLDLYWVHAPGLPHPQPRRSSRRSTT